MEQLKDLPSLGGESISQFSRSVMSDSLQPHGLHAARQASLSITTARAGVSRSINWYKQFGKFIVLKTKYVYTLQPEIPL